MSKLGFHQGYALCACCEISLDASDVPVVSRRVDFFDQCMRQAALYPRWLVVTSTVLAGIAVLWIVAKLLKWTLVVLLALIFVFSLGGLLIWWLG